MCSEILLQPHFPRRNTAHKHYLSSGEGLEALASKLHMPILRTAHVSLNSTGCRLREDMKISADICGMPQHTSVPRT